jgi:co-chaperonin GroES (HSP10)
MKEYTFIRLNFQRAEKMAEALKVALRDDVTYRHWTPVCMTSDPNEVIILAQRDALDIDAM